MRRRTFLCGISAAGPAPVRVYLLAGQSNIAGRGDAGDLPPEYARGREDILYRYRCSFSADKGGGVAASHGWTHLQPCRKHESTPGRHFGPELSFGGALFRRHPGQRIGIVKMGRGGTGLARDWSGPLFPEWMELVRGAMPCQFAGAVWLQGEGDSARAADADAYEGNLRRLAGRVREELELPGLPFLIALAGSPRPNPKLPFQETVREAQRRVAGRSLIPTDDLSRLPDGLHFDSRGLLTLGERMAAALEDYR